jgi:amidohydrolase
MALQTIRSRRTDPMQQMSLAIGTIQGGLRTNILADEVKLTGTLRTLDPDIRSTAKMQMREILAGITAAYGTAFDLKFTASFPMVLNERKLLNASIPSLQKTVGASKVMLDAPELGSEEFAFYQEVIPGFFFHLGIFNKDKGIESPAHTGTFDVDESCLLIGVKAMSNLVMDFLDREAKGNRQPEPRSK